MIRVCTEYLLPGMIVAKKIPGVDGGILLESGALLGDEQIALLKAFGYTRHEVTRHYGLLALMVAGAGVLIVRNPRKLEHITRSVVSQSGE